jgi:hypothetical protein
VKSSDSPGRNSSRRPGGWVGGWGFDAKGPLYGPNSSRPLGARVGGWGVRRERTALLSELVAAAPAALREPATVGAPSSSAAPRERTATAWA